MLSTHLERTNQWMDQCDPGHLNSIFIIITIYFPFVDPYRITKSKWIWKSSHFRENKEYVPYKVYINNNIAAYVPLATFFAHRPWHLLVMRIRLMNFIVSNLYHVQAMKILKSLYVYIMYINIMTYLLYIYKYYRSLEVKIRWIVLVYMFLI